MLHQYSTGVACLPRDETQSREDGREEGDEIGEISTVWFQRTVKYVHEVPCENIVRVNIRFVPSDALRFWILAAANGAKQLLLFPRTFPTFTMARNYRQQVWRYQGFDDYAGWPAIESPYVNFVLSESFWDEKFKWTRIQFTISS